MSTTCPTRGSGSSRPRRSHGCSANGRAAPDEYTAVVQRELDQVADRDPGFLFHDDLAAINDPVYFHEFADHAARHGLQFLGDGAADDELCRADAAGAERARASRPAHPRAVPRFRAPPPLPADAAVPCRSRARPGDRSGAARPLPPRRPRAGARGGRFGDGRGAGRRRGAAPGHPGRGGRSRAAGADERRADRPRARANRRGASEGERHPLPPRAHARRSARRRPSAPLPCPAARDRTGRTAAGERGRAGFRRRATTS